MVEQPWDGPQARHSSLHDAHNGPPMKQRYPAVQGRRPAVQGRRPAVQGRRPAVQGCLVRRHGRPSHISPLQGSLKGHIASVEVAAGQGLEQRLGVE